MEGVEWFGLFVPAGTPNEIVVGLNAAVRKSLESDAIKSSFGQQAFDAAGCTPAEFAQLIKADREMWAATVRCYRVHSAGLARGLSDKLMVAA